jgi:protoporphyrinogen oxidase
MSENNKTAIIIGAGPAGLTAAYELVHKTGIKPIVIEMDNIMGGISRTVNYKGNRIDIGGHRFFSKSDTVMKWWKNILPVQGTQEGQAEEITYQGKKASVETSTDGPNPDTTDKLLLIRHRVSRIYYLRKFFDYPVALNLTTITNLGIVRMVRLMIDYVLIRLNPIKNEKSLEDFFINRFGNRLYRTFFKDYTEKVWGISTDKISADWGAQRIKGISITKVLINAVKSLVKTDKSIDQKNKETSLIERFLYPKYGPGQMWEEVARIVKEKGGEIVTGQRIVGITHDGKNITSVKAISTSTNETTLYQGDYFFSTMPVKELIENLSPAAPKDVQEVAEGLMYRSFVTVGLLSKELKVKAKESIDNRNKLIPDNWIYIQEPDVKVGRIQVFNNWSPYLVKDAQNTVWIGLEYFCNEGDSFWQKSDEEIRLLAIEEVAKIDIIKKENVLDYTVIKMPKTYPAYFGTYEKFDTIKEYVSGFENLFLIGRNGMHKYNNQDHSMLTAITAVANISKGIKSKDNIWRVNTEGEYHEEK